jgi:Arc/MetJ-type ribon-helix-helix transcriptional regulator
MSRTGLTKPQVRACRDQLLAEGRYPSVDVVRQALGNTGSKSTIHRYLKELAEEDAPAGAQRGDTARTLHDIVEQLADKLHGDAQARIRRLEAAHAQALREKEHELAALRASVARLQARVEELEEDRAFSAPPRQVSQGFGRFSSCLSASRGGLRDISPFSMMSAGARSEAFDVDSMRPPALKFL